MNWLLCNAETWKADLKEQSMKITFTSIKDYERVCMYVYLNAHMSGRK